MSILSTHLGIVPLLIVVGLLDQELHRAFAALPRQFHVAVNGNDAWSGIEAAPDPPRSQGPFATLGRAVEAVRQLRKQEGGHMARAVTVFVHAGRYELSEPLLIPPEVSGAEGSQVSFEAYQNERPVISGGRRIQGWRAVTVQGRSLWAATVPQVTEGKWFFHQLWVNGHRRVRARHPNAGYLRVAEIPEAKADVAWTQGQASFRFHEGDWKLFPSQPDAEVVVMNRWVESRLPVAGVDEPARTLRFNKRSVFKLEPGDLYYAENALEWLDVPGEWCLDRAAGTLYYLPLPGEDLNQSEVIAPALDHLLRFDGHPEKSQFVDHVRFRGLTFSHTEWYFPAGFDTAKDKAEVWPPPAGHVGGFSQAAIGVPGAVRAEGLRHSRFEGCRFVHLGGYGLELGRGCQSNVISRCELSDLGAGGIRLGETGLRDNSEELAWGNEVSDCQIHDGGLMFHSAIGVWIGQSPGNRLLHNHIHDFYYTGISAGWTWGYGRALATNTLVAFNHVHHIGVKANGDGPILSDMAGIYTLGLHAGSVIHNNLWHDIAGLRYGGWGIYFDEGTTLILAESNLVYRTTHGGFHQHYGRDNTVRNNLFIDARDFQVQRTRAESHRSFTFERNIVSWLQGRLLEGNFDGTTNYLFRSNLYGPPAGGSFKFAKWSFEEWRQRGQDAGSMIADPRFVQPGKDDYGLRLDSPAFGLGFKPLDLRTVGVRPAR